MVRAMISEGDYRTRGTYNRISEMYGTAFSPTVSIDRVFCMTLSEPKYNFTFSKEKSSWRIHHGK
jgi:hypothetical protein